MFSYHPTYFRTVTQESSGEESQKIGDYWDCMIGVYKNVLQAIMPSSFIFFDPSLPMLPIEFYAAEW